MRKLRKPILTGLLALVVIALALSLVPQVSAAPPKITAKDHEGERSNGVYTSGNVTQYSEGDSINFRFTLDGDARTNGQLEVRFTGDDGTCLFFDGTFSLGTHDGSHLAIEVVSGSAPTVTPVGSPVATDFGTSSGEWVQTLNISFTGNGKATVYYYLTLGDFAGECNGSSQHSRLEPAGGAVRQSGKQNVPVPANQVYELPEITVIKKIDRDGNGSFESFAAEDEYQFCLDGSTCLSTDSTGKVLFVNVQADGNHTITENQLDTSQGTYEFASGSGTNCTFDGGTATATVATGQTATDATCTFDNGVTIGGVSGMKWNDLDGQGDQDGGSETGLSDWTIHIFNATGFHQTTTTDGSGNYSFSGLAAGAYTVCEELQSGWTQTYPSSGPDCTAYGDGRGYTVNVVAGQTQTGKDFGNRQPGGLGGPKFHDLDGDGYWEIGELAMPGWEIVLKDDQGQVVATTTTDSQGKYAFSGLGLGDYEVCETGQPGWVQTRPDDPVCYRVTLNTPGQVISKLNFGNFEEVSVTVCKQEDADGSTGTSVDRTDVAGWTVYMRTNGVTDSQNPASTGEDGCYTWDHLGPNPGGTYGVAEDVSPGWSPLAGTDTTHDFGEPQSGQDYSWTFLNYQDGSITACKWNDLTGDGLSNDDTPIQGWALYLDSDSMKQTDSQGCVTWSGLAPGQYEVSEETRSGWTATSQTSIQVMVESGNSKTVNFTNSEQTVVTGGKFADLDGDGSWGNGEPGLEGWTIYLCPQPEMGDDNVEVASVVDGSGCRSTQTKPDGSYSFGMVDPGNYVVCEVPQSGWTQTAPSSGFACEGIEDAGGTGYAIQVTSGQSVTDRDFGNDPDDVFVGGLKFNDTNKNSNNDGEPGLEGWLIHLTGKDIGGNDVVLQTTTDSSGNYSFTVELGSYTVCESLVSSWTQTFPTSGVACVSYGIGTGYGFEAGPGQEVTGLDFGNWKRTEGGDDDDDTGGDDVEEEEILPLLGPGISKVASEDTVSLGETVTWTVQVNRPSSANVATVQDTIPEEFTVVSISADQGIVSQNGNAITVDLSSVPPGQTVTITIITTVSQLAEGGEVCNTAFIGSQSAEACVFISPVELPALGGRPVGPSPWPFVSVGVGVLAVGGYLLRRRFA